MQFKRFYPYLLITPALVLISLVSLYPTLYSFVMSLHRYRRGEASFVGLRNFEVILGSGEFWSSLQRTFAFGAFFVALTLVLAFAFAAAFNRGLHFGGVYMTIIFIPWMLSEIVSGVMFRWLFLPGYGLAQQVIGPLLGDIKFLADPSGAMGVVVGATVWRMLAFAMLLLLAGLQTIPRDIYQAAVIDGSSNWQSFWHITLPLVRPTVMVTLLFLTIQAVNTTGMFLAITEGGPGRSTEVLSLHMYKQAIEFFDFGYGAALAVVMFALNALLAAIYVRTLRSQSVW